MKKIFLIAIVALFATTVSAQENGKWALGPRMSVYANTGDTVFGLGAYARYSITDHWRLEPSIMGLFHSGCSIDANFDVQYLFRMADWWNVYPAVGITGNDFGGWAVGLNVGGGFDFRVADRWDITLGVKWSPMFDDNRKNPIAFSVGAAYRF